MAKDVDHGRPVRAVTVHEGGGLLAADGRVIRLVTEVEAGELLSGGRVVGAVGEASGVRAEDGQIADAVEFVAAGILGSQGRPIEPVSRYDLLTGEVAGPGVELRVLAIGDSITANAGSVPDLWSANNGSVPYQNDAVGGVGLGDDDDTGTTVWGQWNNASAFAASVVYLHVGANDVGLPGDAPDYAERVFELCDAIRLTGATVALATVLPRDDQPAMVAFRAALNPLLRDGLGVRYDALVDYDTCEMGASDAAAEDTDLYGDGIHPTALGYSIMFPVGNTQLNGLADIANEPLGMEFEAVLDATADSDVTSDPYTVAGLFPGESLAYSVSGGEVSKNGGGFSGAGGTVVEGDELTLRGHSDDEAAGEVVVSLTVGTTIATFSIVTEGAGGGPWTPAELGSRLKLWLTPDGIAVTGTGSFGGSEVSWADESPAGETLTRGGTQYPILSDETINGFDTVKFDGTYNNYFRMRDTMLSGRSSSSFYYVGKQRSNTDLSGIPYGSTGTQNDWVPYAGTTDCYSAYCSTTRYGGFNPGIALNDWRFGSYHSDTNDWRFYLDGEVRQSSGANTFSAGNSLLSIGWSHNSCYNGSLAEIIDVSDKCTTLERQKIEGYLAWKYGLEANLPSGHPYESAAPTT